MRSIKAVAAGSLFIIVVILLMQLAFIFIAVGYNALAKHYPLLNEISGSFRYIIGIPILTLIMFSGGYITAAIANKRVLLHCSAVGLITTAGMMYSALENANLTLTGVFVFVFAVTATVAGGFYWQNNNIDT